jgi:hypothetical protein
MEKFQNSVDDVRKALKEIETRHVVCQDPVNNAENLNDTCEKCSRLAKENKWQIWWKSNIRSIQLAFSFIGIIIFFLLLIGFIKIIF